MVYTDRPNILISDGEDMKKYSKSEAADKIGVSRSAFEMWFLKGKVKYRARTIGKMTYYEIDEKEVQRLKSEWNKKAN